MDSVDQVSLRNLVLAALVVWGVFAAVWYLLLHEEPPLRSPAGGRPVVGSVPPPVSREASSGLESFAARQREPKSAAGAALDADPPRGTAERIGESGALSAPPAAPPRTQSPESPAPSPQAPPPGGSGEYTIQVGAFRSPEGAAALLQRLRQGGWSAEVAEGDLYRVLVGRYESLKAARRDLERLQQQGFEAFARRR